MTFERHTLAAVLAGSVALAAGAPVSAHGSGGAAVAGLFGGMLLGNALHAQREEAYRSGYDAGAYAAPPPPRAYYNEPPPPTVVVQQPAASAGGSVEQRLEELKSLQSKGLISEQDYASRKKAILDSL